MKYILAILFLFTSFIGFSQPYLGTPSTLTLARGHFRSDSGLQVSYNFTDTISANLGILETIPNLLIVANDTIYKRSTDLTAWRQIGGGGTVGNTIYTGDGSLSGDRIVDLNGSDISWNYNGRQYFYIDPNESSIKIEADPDGDTRALMYLSAVPGSTVSFDILSTDNIHNNVRILGDAVASNIAYTADTHTFNVGSNNNNKVVLGAGDMDIQAFDATGNGNSSRIHGSATPTEAYYELIANFNDGVKISQIVPYANATESEITYTADTHTFNGVINWATQFTPANSTDATYPAKTITADDTFLWYRTSGGTWVKIAWTSF